MSMTSWGDLPWVLVPLTSCTSSPTWMSPQRSAAPPCMIRAMWMIPVCSFSLIVAPWKLSRRKTFSWARAKQCPVTPACVGRQFGSFWTQSQDKAHLVKFILSENCLQVNIDARMKRSLFTAQNLNCWKLIQSAIHAKVTHERFFAALDESDDLDALLVLIHLMRDVGQLRQEAFPRDLVVRLQ